MTAPDHHQELVERAEFTGIERRDLAAQDTAVCRATLGLAEIGEFVGRSLARVAAVVAAQRVAPVGPPFTRYVQVGAARFDVEVGLPVARAVDAETDVQPSSLPAGPVVVTVHAGPFDTVGEAYGRLEAWATEHHERTAPGPWEVYLTDPSTVHDPADWRTEVVVPLAVD